MNSPNDLPIGPDSDGAPVLLLPADHREQKTRQQDAFLRSGHPASFGIWQTGAVRIISVPEIGDSRSW